MKALCWHGKSDMRYSIAAGISARSRWVGAYGGYLDMVPMGSAVNRGLTFRMAQIPVRHGALADGPALYQKFRDKKDGCIKAVMSP